MKIIIILSLVFTIQGLRMNAEALVTDVATLQIDGHGSEAEQEEHQKLIEKFHQDTKECNDLRRQTHCVNAVKKAMKILKASVSTNTHTCLFHTALDSDVSRRSVAMMTKSFLATQASTSKLIMYTNSPDDLKMKLNASLSSCQFQEDWNTRIKVKELSKDFKNIKDFASLKGDFVNKELSPQDTAKSDLLRFKLLARYGGIYTDADMLFLADLSPLCGASFAYRWSYLNAFNTAVMGLPKGSPYALAILKSKGADHRLYHPQKLPESIAGVKLIRLPSLLFDPAWLHSDGYDNIEPASEFKLTIGDFDTKPLPPLTFFADPTKDPFDDAFPGSFTYHWHGGRLSSRSTCKYHEEGGSMAVQIERAFSKKFNCGQC